MAENSGNGLPDEGQSPEPGHRMAAEGMPFPWRWNGGMNSTNLEGIWGMSVKTMYEGSCLCGSIRYSIDGELSDFGYCHCISCRKASGSAHAANAGVDRSRLHIVDADGSLKEYESTPGKFRAFCATCG